MTNTYLLLLTVTLSFSTPLFSQKEDPSCMPPSKKTQKLMDAGSNAPDAKTAVEHFNNAMKEAPDNAGVYFAYGMYAYNTGVKYYETLPNPATGDKSFQKAEEMFQKAVEYCNDYHSDMYYLLGVISYTQEDQATAMQWFEKFVAYKHNEPSRYSDDYTKKLADVKEILSELKANAEFASVTVPFNPVMVANVSSKEDEFFPMLSPDNELMFFTRKSDISNLGDIQHNVVEQFTFAQRADDTKPFNSGKPFSVPFNTGDFDSYGAATMSVDNKEMIICACKKTTVYDQPYLNCDLYSTTFEKIGDSGDDYKWSELVNLGPKINTADGWEGQPSMSADGKTLFYTTNRKTTQDNDVYIVKRNPDGTWGAPRPFDEINTPAKDKSPFLHQDSETLYFVSTSTQERQGAGGLDIFYMRQENGGWSKPKNIGIPINTPEDELGIFVSTDGKLAYYSSRNGGNWNIWSFELYEEARPKKVSILKGELKDPSGNAVTDATIEVAYANSDLVESVKVNGNDGKYAVVVKQEVPQDIMLTVKKEGSAFDSKLITKEAIVKKEDRVHNDLAVKALKVGEAYTINDILYDYNSDMLSDKSKFILREFARYLKDHKSIQISIQGHTDSDGDDAKNLDLSDRRAKGVKDFLASQGIDESRLTSKGFGETQPKVPNDTAENKAKNRRTDFVITGM